MSDSLSQLISRAEGLINKLEALIPTQVEVVNWNVTAWRWVKAGAYGHLQAVHHPHTISLDNIQFIDRQKIRGGTQHATVFTRFTC